MALDLSKCYRAKVTNNNYKKAPAKAAPGSVEVFVPDWTAEKVVGNSKGLVWAAPINANFLGSDSGNAHKNVGQCIIPPVGSDVWVAIEDGNYAHAYYFGSVALVNPDTIPDDNKQLTCPQNAYTLLKTPMGRGIVVVDEGKDKKSGIVIKGKGSSTGSVLSDDNQMSIVLSENTFNGIIIKSGNGKQFIIIDKDANTIDITQGESRIHMSEDRIDIESDIVNIRGNTRINLN